MLTCAQAFTDMKKGAGGGEIQGAAGTSGTHGEASDLERCQKPMGTIAVVEPQGFVIQALSRYNLQSPVGLIRMMIQQSNCFIVVERGTGMQNVMQERDLMDAGQLRQQSNIGGGQMVVADFILTPSVVFSESNAGGIGGALGGLFGGSGGKALGVLAGGLKFKEAQTSMLLADSRSGIQVAAAEGSSKKADLNLGGGLFGGGMGAALGGYGNTNEGKIITASFADNYNNIVRVVRNDPNLQRDVGTLGQEAASGGKVKAGAVFGEGDILLPKISNVKLMSEPKSTSSVVVTLSKSDEMIFMGEEENGFILVETSKGGGWIKKVFAQ
jgi:curli biogenesis system outer membrane secretion channel CsgG